MQWVTEQNDRLRHRAVTAGIVRDDALIMTVRSHAKASVGDGDAPTATVIATTDGIDLDGEVVVPSGVDESSYFFKNGSVFVDHRYDADAYVGKLRSYTPWPSKEKHRAWKVGIRHRPMGESALSDDLLKVARRGDIGTSIGFEVVEASPPDEDEQKRYGKGVNRVIRLWKWLELSYTFMPCNVEAQAIASGAFVEQRNAELDAMVSKGLIRRESAYALGLPVRKALAAAPSEKGRRTLMMVLG